MAAFREALDLLPADHPETGLVFLNRGNVHLQRGDVPEAVATSPRRGTSSPGPGRRSQRAKAEHNLGYARLLTGDLVGAIQTIDEAAPVLRPLSAPYRATVEQDRAEVLTAAGRPREASRGAGRGGGGVRVPPAAHLPGRVRAHPGLDAAARGPRQGTGGRPAMRLAASAARPARCARCSRTRPRWWPRSPPGRRQRSVLDRVDALVAELRRHGHHRDATVLELQGARVACARGDLDGARTRLRRVRVDASSPVTTRLLWREVRAELAQARGDRRQRPRSTSAPASRTCTPGSPRSAASTCRARSSATVVTWPGRGLALALEQGDPELVFEWSERARALVGRVAPVRPPADEQVSPRPDRAARCCRPSSRSGVRPGPGGPRSCASGCGSAGGTARAPARSASRPASTSCEPRSLRTMLRWSPTSSYRTGSLPW